MNRTYFAVRLLFHQVSIIFNTLYHNWVRRCLLILLYFLPRLWSTSRAVQENFKETAKSILKVSPDRNMIDVLLLHDNARPHTSLRRRETVPKMGWTVLPPSAHSPDLSPSNCHLFGPVKCALHGRHLADVNELKQSFRVVLLDWGNEFYHTVIRRLPQR
jgi:hypothetical protein